MQASAQTQAPASGAPAPSVPPAMPPPAAAQTPAPAGQAPSAVQGLTLADAEKIAVQNHPLVQIAEHRAAYAKAQVQEAQSAYFPQATGDLTGAYAETNSRITAGGLSNPRIFDRFASGVFVSQLVTDFGRTQSLVKSSSLHARAQQEGVITSRADILLQVHDAYFASLKSKALLTVANETVKDRQVIADQITLMQKNQLKSGLDVAFANVDLAQAKLLLIQAQNDLQASYANLSVALGYHEPRSFDLAELPVPPAPPPDFVPVLQQAFMNRPELVGQRFEVNAARSYAIAERDLWFPTLGAVGAAGLTPYREDALTSTRYAATGFNLSIPIFNGHLFGSLRTQANEQYRAQQQYLRDLEDRIARDVRTAWLNANSAFERLAVTEQLLQEATLAEDLATSRYKMGLSSIVELSQAQLNLTQAQIQEASAKYDFQARTSELLYQQGLLR
jgi:outer membrane protein